CRVRTSRISDGRAERLRPSRSDENCAARISAPGGGRGRLPGHLADRMSASLSVTAGAYTPLPDARRSLDRCLPKVRKMQKRSSLPFTALISMSIVALTAESGAQNNGGTLPPEGGAKTGTRLITLGTRGGP